METALISREERKTGNLPEIEDNLPDLANYNRTFIGGPIWDGYTATPLQQYLKLADLTDKTVIAFWTDHGSGMSSYITDFNNLVDSSHKILEAGDEGYVARSKLNILFHDPKDRAVLDTRPKLPTTMRKTGLFGCESEKPVFVDAQNRKQYIHMKHPMPDK